MSMGFNSSKFTVLSSGSHIENPNIFDNDEFVLGDDIIGVTLYGAS